MSARYGRAFAPACVLLATLALPAMAGGPAHRVAGEKLDSGLGELPHYRDWAQHPATRHLVVRGTHVPGEKLDSGLGELKHYRYWVDNTGRTELEVASRR